jgi:hypothetical protein
VTLQNRVTPFGTLVADPARGTLMGNRGGRLHDPETRALQGRRQGSHPYVSRRWICCLLAFKARRRAVWGRGYTELFFLDEVTALAAGHRPCAECRRTAARAFLAAAGMDGVGALDRALHAERLGPRPAARLGALPDGAMVARGAQAFALRTGLLLPWSPAGYGAPIPLVPRAKCVVLTPATTLAALRAGYRPLWHASAPA